MDPLLALESLFLKMFSADELRRFLRYLPDGEALSAALPGPTASPMSVASAVVAVLDRGGYLTGPVVWQRLGEERPRRRAEIDAVRALFAQTTPVDLTPPGVLTIVLASASPVDATQLRVDKEFPQIIGKLRGSRHRDRLKVVQLTALRFEDLRTALMEHKPHILHLSCHGEPDGSVLFESSTKDGAKSVSKKQLLRLLNALGSNLRLVVFNACHSTAIARDVPPTIGLSVGMSDEIRDSSAIEFSAAFYEALAFGESVQAAFDAALASLDDDDDVPELFPTAQQDPEKRRQLPLVVGTSS